MVARLLDVETVETIFESPHIARVGLVLDDERLWHDRLLRRGPAAAPAPLPTRYFFCQ
jgi:hypothetical protein